MQIPCHTEAYYVFMVSHKFLKNGRGLEGDGGKNCISL